MANGTNYFTSDNDDASNIVRYSRAGKLNTKPLINKEIVAIKLNKNTALLKAFAKYLVYKSTIIYSLGDNTY